MEAVYPVRIYSQSDDLIARVNLDGSWSVLWPEVSTQAYETLTDDNIAVVAICRLLLAGRDNFRVTPWIVPMTSTSLPQVFVPADFKCVVVNPTARGYFILRGQNDIAACVHKTAEWSVNWSEVLTTRLADKQIDRIPAIGFCELLTGAKDNFIVVPFPPDVLP
jgi:hypothetical protein